VQRIQRYGVLSKVIAGDQTFTARKLVFCCGLHSDRMAKKDGVEKLGMQIVGFRGDYYNLTPEGEKKIKHLIYPVPNPEFPFLGVHFTRMALGGIECGPNAVFTFKREGYHKTSFSLKDTLDALTYKGTWKLFFKHWKFGLNEYRRAFSQKLFLKTLQRLIPDLTMSDITPGHAGVRAMALDPSGDMIEDFKIEYKDHSIHVLNAPSPAASACLAIGEEITNMAEKHFSIAQNN
jgi:L-2-hydroxyglutarate oxidase